MLIAIKLTLCFQKLDTPAQRQVQNIDAVEVILAHMKEQHSSTREMYEVTLNHRISILITT